MERLLRNNDKDVKLIYQAGTWGTSQQSTFNRRRVMHCDLASAIENHIRPLLEEEGGINYAACGTIIKGSYFILKKKCGWLLTDSDDLLKKIRGAGRTDFDPKPRKQKQMFHSTSLKISKSRSKDNDDLVPVELNLGAMQDHTVPWANITLPDPVPTDFCQLDEEIELQNEIDFNNAEQIRCIEEMFEGTGLGDPKSSSSTNLGASAGLSNMTNDMPDFPEIPEPTSEIPAMPEPQMPDQVTEQLGAENEAQLQPEQPVDRPLEDITDRVANIQFPTQIPAEDLEPSSKRVRRQRPRRLRALHRSKPGSFRPLKDYDSIEKDTRMSTKKKAKTSIKKLFGTQAHHVSFPAAVDELQHWKRCSNCKNCDKFFERAKGHDCQVVPEEPKIGQIRKDDGLGLDRSRRISRKSFQSKSQQPPSPPPSPPALQTTPAVPEFPQQAPEEMPLPPPDMPNLDTTTFNGYNETIPLERSNQENQIPEHRRSQINNQVKQKLEKNLNENHSTSFFTTARGMNADCAAALFYQVLKKAHYTNGEIKVQQDTPYGDIHILKN